MKDFDDKVMAAACLRAGKEPTIGSSKSVELGLRDLWESDRECFIAGANFARELMQSEHIDGCDHCSIIASAGVTDLNTISKLKVGLALAVSALEIYAEKPSDVAWIALAKIRARD